MPTKWQVEGASTVLTASANVYPDIFEHLPQLSVFTKSTSLFIQEDLIFAPPYSFSGIKWADHPHSPLVPFNAFLEKPQFRISRSEDYSLHIGRDDNLAGNGEQAKEDRPSRLNCKGAEYQ
jgi:hypothetical protein